MAVKYWTDKIDVRYDSEAETVTFTYHLHVDDGVNPVYQTVVENVVAADGAETTDHATAIGDATGGTPNSTPIT